MPMRHTRRVSDIVCKMRKLAAILLIIPLLFRAACFGIAFALIGFTQDFTEVWKNGHVE